MGRGLREERQMLYFGNGKCWLRLKQMSVVIRKNGITHRTFPLRPLLTSSPALSLGHNTDSIVHLIPLSPASQTIPKPILPNDLNIRFLAQIKLLSILQLLRRFSQFR